MLNKKPTLLNEQDLISNLKIKLKKNKKICFCF